MAFNLEVIMHEAVVLGSVAMVCVTIGGTVVLALFLGRNFVGRATKNSVEVSTDAVRKGK